MQIRERIKKTGTLTQKRSNMNNDAANSAIGKSVNINNESNTDVEVFSADAATTISAASASAINPDAHFLSSGLKLDNKIFSEGRIKTWFIRIQSTPPLPPTHLTLIPPTLPPEILAPMNPILHIY